MLHRLFSCVFFAALIFLPSAVRGEKPPAPGPQLGLQTWTCRNMNFEQVLDFAAKHGITQIEFIPTQLDPAAPPQETLRKKALLEQRGLTAYSFGVNQTGTPEQNRALFELAKLMG